MVLAAMPLLRLDLFDDPTAWSAVAPGGGPSTLLEIAPAAPPPEVTGGVRLAWPAGAVGHRGVMTMPRRDLTGMEDLQCWVRADRAVDSDTGFALAIKLSATNLAVDAPSNTWRRYLHAATAHRWALTVLSLADLPDRVRANCNGVQVEVVATTPGVVELAGAGAVRREPLRDVEEALVELLGGRVQIDGAPVPAVVSPDQPAAAGPHLRIRPVAVREAVDLVRGGEVRTDYTDRGFRVRPAPHPLHVEYAVDVVADTRAAQRHLTDFLLRTIPDPGSLMVAGRPTSIAWSGSLGVAGEPPLPSAPIRLTVARPAVVGPVPQTRPYDRIDVEVGHA